MINAKPNQSPQEAILQLTMGFAVTQAIFAIVKLGIPDLITETAESCDSLAQTVKVDRDTLYRQD